jgi:hypothetical protein
MVDLGTPPDHEDNTVATPTPPELDSRTIPNFGHPDIGEQSRVAPTIEAAEWLADWLQGCGFTNITITPQSSGEYLIAWK